MHHAICITVLGRDGHPWVKNIARGRNYGKKKLDLIDRCYKIEVVKYFNLLQVIFN